MQMTTAFRIISSMCFLIGFTMGKETTCGGDNYVPKTHNDLKKYEKIYQCPLSENDAKNVDCCDPPSYGCCQPAKTAFGLEYDLGIILAVGIIVVLLGSTIGMVICCCWEKCPLYMFCRREAKLDYIASVDEAEVLHMPGENTAELKTYDPCKVNAL